jgi:5-(carboxyamino)imidazole ribonucleotide synthase
VNEAALEQLEKEGVAIFPKPSALKIIKNKILQKQFYRDNKIPTSDFIITEKRMELEANHHFLPAVHKIGMGGYDGRGVQVIKNKEDIFLGFDAPGVLEKLVNIKKEIAVIVAVDKKGNTAVYPVVDMVFVPVLNLLNYQVSPADLDEKIVEEAKNIAVKVVAGLQSPGIFAIEMFIDENNNLLVNETAPRVHNSGHHTIESNYSSQFDMLWRIILDYPLGNTNHVLPAAIVNILGADGFSGEAVYQGLEEVLKMENVFVHLYGKKQTKPGRKMGHVTVLGNQKQELIDKVLLIKNTLKVIS